MKKKGLSLILVALCLINMIMNIVIIFSVVPQAKKSNELITKICEYIDLDIGDVNPEKPKQTGVSIEDTTTVKVLFGEKEEATINLSKGADGKTHYAKVSVVLSLNNKAEDFAAKSATITTTMDLISSIIYEVVEKATFDNIDKDQMCKEILSKIQSKYDTTCVYEAKFNQFLVQ